jgi:hypothetical protein
MMKKAIHSVPGQTKTAAKMRARLHGDFFLQMCEQIARNRTVLAERRILQCPTIPFAVSNH